MKTKMKRDYYGIYAGTMKIIQIVRIISFMACLVMIGCREPYTPPELNQNPNYLVVDGFLNSGGVTTIVLSRARGLNDSLPNMPEYGAQVSVTGSQGETFYLQDAGAGTYRYDSLPLSPFEIYKLQITTTNGQKYISDSITILQTPLIDSVNWKQDTTGPDSKLGVNVYVSTHDASSTYGYYRWEYEETWKYRSAYESAYIYDNGAFIPRSPDQQVYYCWHDVQSTSLVIGSTYQLSQNLVYQQPVIFIPQGSEKISIKYSILVTQFSISKTAYEYWQNLQQTSELTGSIFDPLPSSVTGNLHNISNPNEPVIGFISGSSANSQRIFISNTQVQHWGYLYGQGCQELVLNPGQFDAYFRAGGYIPTSSKGIVDMGATTPSCGDCTTHGGTNVQPPFWQ
jgi:uncharacterized protein DUF4249